jgi:hypothetical protein
VKLRIALILSAASLVALAIAGYAMLQGMFLGVGSPATGEFYFLLAVVLALVARLVARTGVEPGWRKA